MTFTRSDVALLRGHAENARREMRNHKAGFLRKACEDEAARLDDLADRIADEVSPPVPCKAAHPTIEGLTCGMSKDHREAFGYRLHIGELAGGSREEWA